MAFTASVTEFGHTFAEAVVEVTEANLEYRLNDYGAPADPGGVVEKHLNRLLVYESITKFM